MRKAGSVIAFLFVSMNLISGIIPVKGEVRITHNHWASASAERLIARGVLSKFPDKKSDYDKPITLAEIDRMISRILPVSEERTIIEPDKNVYREEAAVLLSVLAERMRSRGGYSPVHRLESFYADEADISSHAREAVNLVTLLGIMTGYEDNTFRPKQLMTCAEAYTSLDHLLGLYAPVLTVDAVMGGQFRTVDLSVSLIDEAPFTRIYYLALAQGSPEPSSATILAYAEGRKTAGLTDGSVARGYWITSHPYDGTVLSLSGAENMTRIQNETGLIDGYRYDIYLTVINPNGTQAASSAVKDVMVQPFDAMSADQKTFTLRTARQLENIQRLADLYIETQGQHGSLDFLTSSDYTYVLDADINLIAEGRGWKPIGDADANPRFVFRGSFDGQHHVIRGIYMDKDTSRDGQSFRTQGLFGRVEDATIRNLTLSGAAIRIAGDYGRKPLMAGILAGETVGGTIDHIVVENAALKAYGPDRGSGYVGGVIGHAADTHMYNITTNDTAVISYGAIDSYAGSIGGIVGYYSAAQSNRLLRSLSSGGSVYAATVTEAPVGSTPVCAGGIIGFMEAAGQQEQLIHADDWKSSCAVTGGVFTGGLVGLTQTETETPTTITFDTCHFSGRVKGFGQTGGLFGRVSSVNNGVLIKNALSNGQVSVMDNAPLGGLAGVLVGCAVENSLSIGSDIVSDGDQTGGFTGSAEFTRFNQCFARRNVSGGDDTGGFIGVAADSVDFQSCAVEASYVKAGKNAGGFAGRIQNNAKVYGCHSTPAVTGDFCIGGFAGTVYGKTLSSNAGHTADLRQCFATGSVEAASGFSGGFAGQLAYASVDQCRAAGRVTAQGPETGGFCGKLTNMSRIANANAIGDVINTSRCTGGFVGQITNASCVEYAYASGYVSGGDDTGGFVGKISAFGAPNTMTGCLSFSPKVAAGSDDVNTRRFAGRMDHDGVNDCYVYRSGVVTTGTLVCPITSNAFGADGADLDGQTLFGVLNRLGWDDTIWHYGESGAMPKLASLPVGV